jgi:CBS domain containing-hemolysin-like protein
MASLGEMPVVGDEVEEYGYRFTIQSIENHRVGKLLVEKLDMTDPENQDTDTSSTDS